VQLHLCLHWLDCLLFHNLYKDTIKKLHWWVANLEVITEYTHQNCGKSQYQSIQTRIVARHNTRAYTPELSQGTIPENTHQNCCKAQHQSIPDLSQGTIFLFLNHKQFTKLFHTKYLCLYLPSNQLGHAMPLTLKTWIQSQAWLWNLGWAKWNWDSYFPEYISFSLSVSLHQCSILVHSSITSVT
jgi:hypothetical protein